MSANEEGGGVPVEEGRDSQPNLQHSDDYPKCYNGGLSKEKKIKKVQKNKKIKEKYWRGGGGGDWAGGAVKINNRKK